MYKLNIPNFLYETYIKKEYLHEEIEKDHIKDAEKIIKTFSSKEKEWLGPRKFYDLSQYRKILYDNSKPICFIEAVIIKILHKAKINMGCDPKYRKKVT